MFNFNDEQLKKTNSKVISIKDLSEIKQIKSQSSKDVIESDHREMQEQISQTKQEIASLQTKKTELLEEIKTVIEQEKEAWLTTKEQEREEAQKVGYKTGYDAGEEKAQQSYEEKLNEANLIIDAAKTDYLQTVSKHEKTIIQLAVTTAEKILHQKLAEDEQYIMDIVHQGISDVKDQANIAIYVAPTNYEYVMKRKEELEHLLEEGKMLSIYADQKMNEGDCLIKHAYGQVDVGIDVQLQQIKIALEEKVTENE